MNKEIYPKMHWRRRLLIEFGWDSKTKFKVLKKYDLFEWLKNDKNIPNDINQRKNYFRKKLNKLIVDKVIAKSLFNTKLMKKETEDILDVANIEKNFLEYFQNIKVYSPKEEYEIILNHFDLHEIRCPSKIINTLFVYEKKQGEIKSKEEFLNYRNIYNNYIINSFFALKNQRINNLNKHYLFKTSINTNALNAKNLLCVGEYNIFLVKDIVERSGILKDNKYKDFNFDEMKIDVIGGVELYMLVSNYKKELHYDYQEIINCLTKIWNDIVIQESLEDIIIPETNDFIENYLLTVIEKWYIGNKHKTFYEKQHESIYLKFKKYEKLFLNK